MGNVPSSVPFGASINLLNITLQCVQTTGPASTIVSLPVVITATAPLYVGYQQRYSYSDLSVAVTLPQQLVYDEREYGYNYRANLTASLAVRNAREGQIVISDSMLRNWTQYEVNIPKNGGVLSRQGDVFPGPGEVPEVLDLQLKSLKVNFQYLRSDGANIDYPRVFTCDGTKNPEYVVASTATYYYDGPVSAPANGFKAQVPVTPSGSKTTIANVPAQCSIDNWPANQPQPPFNLTVGGTGPASVKTGSTISLTNFNSFFTVPGEVISRFSIKDNSSTYRLDLNTGKTSTGQAVPGINLTATAASPATLDLSRDFTGADTPLSATRNVQYSFQGQQTFALPLVSSLSRTLTAGSNGFFGLQLSSFRGSLRNFAPPSNVPAYYNIVCSVLNRPQLVRAQIV